jgi:hypothetical protein
LTHQLPGIRFLGCFTVFSALVQERLKPEYNPFFWVLHAERIFANGIFWYTGQARPTHDEGEKGIREAAKKLHKRESHLLARFLWNIALA